MFVSMKMYARKLGGKLLNVYYVCFCFRFVFIFKLRFPKNTSVRDVIKELLNSEFNGMNSIKTPYSGSCHQSEPTPIFRVHCVIVHTFPIHTVIGTLNNIF